MKLLEMLVICLIYSVLVNNAVGADEPVTIESLLREMVYRDAVARYPEPDFRLRQHSSYNRASKTPDEPEGWFTNKDFNSKSTDKNFIRIEANAGKQEWVLMDHKGPGAIVRTWMPWRHRAGSRREYAGIAGWHRIDSLSAGARIAALGGFFLPDPLREKL